MSARARCAIYTRKSSDDGLEQEFNSLDAQQEACEAFITSQRALGWVTTSTRYEDGGLSGGTLDRPALQSLLQDIRRRRVDIVVVYKVDRLTRSLTDFAKIVDVFDAHGTSFVSVTQQFNTTTAMGRLTLNMLLSFAQFEREVTSERIRDKIAASKQKGMWMGGVPPLGYDVADKKLIVNAEEAEVVQGLFQMYLDLGSVRLLKREADRQGLMTKRRRCNGQSIGGKPFSRGNLYQLLNNPLYVGEMPHKGKTYPGRQQPIIDRETWDAVQQQLAANAQVRRSDKNIKEPCLLAGLVFDNTGDRLVPTYASKNGRRYRYYVSKRLVAEPEAHADGWRIPAAELETIVRQSLCGFLKDEIRITESLSVAVTTPRNIRRALQRASALGEELAEGSPHEIGERLRHLIQRATLCQTSIRIEIRERDLLELIAGGPDEIARETDRTIHNETPIALRRRGVESKLILRTADHCAPDENLIALFARSHDWLERLSAGLAGSVREIAQQDGLDEGDVSRYLPLAFLAPDIVEAIVGGRQPMELTVEALRRVCPIPASWASQRTLLGIAK